MNVPDSAGRLGPPGRGRKLIGPMRLATVLVTGCALLAVVLDLSVFAIAMVAVLVIAPFARVAFFVGRWQRTGDVFFARLALLLVGVAGLAVALALI